MTFLNKNQLLKTLLCSFILILMMSSVAFAQTFNCAAGRIVYAKKYTDLFSEYTGTAAVVETCAATCAQQPQEDRMTCFLLGCGLSCLAVGMSNCVDYFSQKSEITKFKDGVEKICAAEEYNANSGNKDDDQLAWSLAATKGNLEAFEEYIQNCNSLCAYRGEATIKINYFQNLKDNKSWAEAKKLGSAEAAQDYLDNCAPACAHSDKARLIISAAQEAAQELRRAEARAAEAKAQAEAIAKISTNLNVAMQLFLLEPKTIFMISPQNLLFIVFVAETL